MSLKDNKEIMLRKVSEDAWNLQFASERLKNDLDIVYLAITKEKRTITFIGDDLKKKIGEQDPIKYIETALHKQQLEKELAPKTEAKHTKQVSKI